MVKVSVNLPDDEPNQKRFELPSEGEHCFQVTDVLPDKNDNMVVAVKLEVADGDELGRSILHRVNLSQDWKGFFLTRLFLKAIGNEYKGSIEIDTDTFIGRQFYATIIHNIVEKKDVNGNVVSRKTYANIDSFNFDKAADVGQPKTPADIDWRE